jgi:hypothetical protein
MDSLEKGGERPGDFLGRQRGSEGGGVVEVYSITDTESYRHKTHSRSGKRRRREGGREGGLFMSRVSLTVISPQAASSSS